MTSSRCRPWLVIVAALGFLSGTDRATAESLVVEPLEPVVPGVVEEHVLLPMRDGVRLSCYLTRPIEGGPWPVLYQQRYSDVSTEGARRHAATLALHGYAVCVQNFRGAQLSEGPFDGYRSLAWGERQDGFDTVAWLAKQPWSTGKVGTYGGSQAGYAQNFLAVTQPPALVCQYMTDTGLSLFHEGYRIGGATRPARLFAGMGVVAKEKNGRQWVESMLAHPTYDDYWAAEDCTPHFAKMNVPCCTIGSWFDFMNTGSVQSFRGRQHQGGSNSRGKQHLIIGPWLHGGSKAGGSKIGDLTIHRDAGFDLSTGMLKWFDQHFKGATPHLLDPAVSYYVMGALDEPGAPGNFWREANDFPPPADDVPYFLHADGKLSTAAPSDPASHTTYRSDPAHPAPIPGRAYTAARDGRSFESHPDVRSFTTAPLTEAVEWTGLVRAELFVSSTAPDCDFIVRVSDVYPDGRSIMLVESIKRARYREGYDREVLLPAGKPVPVSIDVGWTSQVFNRGHRIHVSVSSSGAEFYEPNPQTGEPAAFDPPTRVVIAENAIYHQSTHASRILAPVPRVVAAVKESGEARVQSLLKTIAEVGPQGTGSAAARTARDELARHGLEILPQLFVAMDTRNVVAMNWYRTVYEEIVVREQAAVATSWPTQFLETYLNDVNRSGRARRLSLSLIEKLDSNFRAKWLPTRLGDPEFDFEAVELAMAAGAAAQKAKDVELATKEYRQAFVHARDSRQVSQSAAKLKQLGEAPNVYRHLGLVVDWRQIATFDAPDRTGFAQVFEPETKLDAMVARKNPFPDAPAVDPKFLDGLGQLDLNDVFGVSQERVGYVFAEIDVAAAQSAEVRCGADDNCTIWLNGAKVLARDQWLNGTRFDRFAAPVSLTAGRNVLLVKVCQGPHHRDPEVPNNWSLQLRLCDASGKGVEFTPVTAAPTESK